MDETDLSEVAAAEARIYPFPWTLGNFADSLASGHQGWICQDGRGIIGYAMVMQVLDELHLLNISVLPERQRRGIGSSMLEHVLDQARRRGARRVYLEVRPSNTIGLAMYRRFGFATVGERRGYYPAADGREDAIVMSLELPAR